MSDKIAYESLIGLLGFDSRIQDTINLFETDILSDYSLTYAQYTYEFEQQEQKRIRKRINIFYNQLIVFGTPHYCAELDIAQSEIK